MAADPIPAELAHAESLVAMRRWADAAAVLGRVVAAEPDDSRALALLAHCHLGLDDPRAAATWAGRAVVADPEDEWPHRLRAAAALRLGDKRAARTAALEAIRLAPHQVAGQLLLVEVELARRNTGAARAAAQRALQLGPVESASHNAMGLVALKARKPKEAEAHFREALRLDPQSDAAMNNIGLALERQGNKRAAIHYYAEASKLDPHDSTARTNATRAARIGAVGGGGIAVMAIARALGRSDEPPAQEFPEFSDAPVPIVIGPDGVGVPMTRPAPTSPPPEGPGSPLPLFAVLLVVGAVAAVTTLWRRRREERSGHPLASKDLIKQIRRNDRHAGIEVRGSWLGVRALLAVVLLVTLSLTALGWTSIDEDGGSAWLTVLVGVAASAAAVRWALPRLRATR